MREHITLGCTPTDEDCAQVGRPDYHERMRRETAAYKAQLLRQHGPPPAGASLRVKGFPHDFGTYHEVCAVYDPENEEAVAYAYKVENDLPESWDSEAVAELAVPFRAAA